MINVAPQRLAQLVASLTYKPGWRFSVGNSDEYGITVHLNFDAPDSNQPDVPFTGHIAVQVPAMINLEVFLHYIQHLVYKAEQHESKEWLRFEGRRIDEPHEASHD